MVISSSLHMLTNSCLGGIMVNLIFLEGLDEEEFVEFKVRILQKSQENGQNWTNTDTGTDRVLKSWEFLAKTGYPMIERIQGQRSNPRGACEEDLEASSPAINRRLLSLTRGIIEE
ncbi:hypothetical protein Tco_0518166 [Tanacetum coccineum]